MKKNENQKRTKMKILKKSYHFINPVSDWHKPENQNAPTCEKQPFLVRFFQSNFIHNRTSILRKRMYMRKYYNPENPEILKILVQTFLILKSGECQKAFIPLIWKILVQTFLILKFILFGKLNGSDYSW